MKAVELPIVTNDHKNALQTNLSSFIFRLISHVPLISFSQQINTYIRTGIILALWDGSLISEFSFQGSFGE